MGFALLICGSQIAWLTFAPITTNVAAVMHVSVGLVGDLSALFPLVYILVGLPAGRWLDVHFRKALVAAALLIGVPSALRLVWPTSYAWQFAMQLLLAIGQPFVLNAIPAFAARWFPEPRRPVAISLCSVAMFVGIVAVMVASPLLWPRGGLAAVELGSAVVPILGMLGTVLAASVPRTFDAHREIQASSMSLRAALGPLLRDTTFWLLTGLLAIGIGLFDALNTWLQPILAVYGLGSLAGRLLAWMTVVGIIGSATLPPWAAARGRRRGLLRVAVGMTTLMFAAMMMSHAIWWLAAWMTLDGLVLLTGYPVIMEWVERYVGSTRQGLAVGFMMLTSHIMGNLLIFVVQFALDVPTIALAIMGAAALCGTVLAWRLPDRITPLVRQPGTREDSVGALSSE
ncbi:MFS transporter [Rubrobacter naiadicus]|uniref:MFS transporter n=1 Tax=Rubrobacter naiadicus TaxID=1392641 RepID=UPI002362146C|nr:MFS transporter [Rubrobacter naiadicus]